METRHKNILKMSGDSSVHLSFGNTSLETVFQWDSFGFLRKATISVENVCGKNAWGKGVCGKGAYGKSTQNLKLML